MQGPEAWLAYLRSVEEAGPANGLSLKVIFPLARHQKSLEWAEVAIRAAELDSRRGSDTEREESLLNAMTLRSWFISQMGSRRPVGRAPSSPHRSKAHRANRPSPAASRSSSGLYSAKWPKP